MKKLKIKIVVADYYKEITNPLIQSCIKTLEQSKFKYEIQNDLIKLDKLKLTDKEID